MSAVKFNIPFRCCKTFDDSFSLFSRWLLSTSSNSTPCIISYVKIRHLQGGHNQHNSDKAASYGAKKKGVWHITKADSDRPEKFKQ